MKPAFLAAALLVALPATALAQQNQLDAFQFRLGGFFPSVDTTVTANGSNGLVGTTINLESDLGLADSKTLPIFDASWRFAQRHRLAFEYVNLDRSASTTLSATIRFGDTVYPVSTVVDSKFDSSVYALTYLYSFYQEGGTEIAAGIGIDYTDISVGISGVAGSLSASKGAKAPLPVLALQGQSKLAQDWSVSSKLAWFGIKYGDYDGSLFTFNAAVQYFPTKNWGIEAGYNYYKYELDVSKSDWNGSANYKFSGPMLNLVGRF